MDFIKNKVYQCLYGKINVSVLMLRIFFILIHPAAAESSVCAGVGGENTARPRPGELVDVREPVLGHQGQEGPLGIQLGCPVRKRSPFSSGSESSWAKHAMWYRQKSARHFVITSAEHKRQTLMHSSVGSPRGGRAVPPGVLHGRGQRRHPAVLPETTGSCRAEQR